MSRWSRLQSEDHCHINLVSKEVSVFRLIDLKQSYEDRHDDGHENIAGRDDEVDSGVRVLHLEWILLWIDHTEHETNAEQLRPPSTLRLEQPTLPVA